MRTVCAMCSVVILSFATAAAQSTNPSVAPTLIPVTGELKMPTGDPRTGTALLVIALYDNKDDSAPRWIEYQTVTFDAVGRYDVQFGSTRESGLPPDLFTTSTGVRWIGVAVENEPEQPRMMLVSVPYAAKAANADTLAGKAVTDFVLSTDLMDEVKAALQETNQSTREDEPTTNAANTLNYLQKGTGSGLEDSAVFESGGNVGIGTAAPQKVLHAYHTSHNGITTERSAAGLYSGHTFLTAGAEKWFVGMTPNSDSFTFRANSTDLVFIGATGNIGIGTAPQKVLHVYHSNHNGITTERSAAGLYSGHTFLTAGSEKWFAGMTPNSDNFTFRANSIDLVAISSAGNVGIGTTSPSAKLHVAGNATVDGNIGAKYQDVAEWVDSTEPLEAGTLVVIDPLTTNRVTAAERPYDPRVAGAISAQPGLVLGESAPGRLLVAQSGRVRVKADATHGAIRPGDLLVSSPTRGHVMRSSPMKIDGQQIHRTGTVVGKALEGLPQGRGEILVLLTLQ